MHGSQHGAQACSGHMVASRSAFSDEIPPVPVLKSHARLRKSDFPDWWPLAPGNCLKIAVCRISPTNGVAKWGILRQCPIAGDYAYQIDCFGPAAPLDATAL